MNVPKMKTAVLGCGAISDAYLSTVTSKFQILDVVGCCNRTHEKAVKKAEQYHIKAMTLQEILEDPSIELVINLTPMTEHYETNKLLLQAGKHVYTEKTLALELDQAKELVDLANEKNLRLGCAPDTFLGASIQTARFVIESGMIGKVSSFTASLTRDYKLSAQRSPGVVKKGFGIAFDVGIYYVTALLSMLGPAGSVTGFMETRDPEGTFQNVDHLGEPYTMTCENIACASVRLQSGVMGNLLFDSNSVLTIPEQPVMVIYGSQGILYMSDPNLFGGDVKVLLKGNTQPVSVQQCHPYDTESRGLGAAEMAWSIRLGRPHRAGKEMAFHALELLTGIGISGETGKRYDLQSSFEKPKALPRGYKSPFPGAAGFEENTIAL